MIVRFFKWFWAEKSEQVILNVCIIGVAIMAFAALVMYGAVESDLIDERFGGLLVVAATLLGLGGFFQIAKRYYRP